MGHPSTCVASGFRNVGKVEPIDQPVRGFDVVHRVGETLAIVDEHAEVVALESGSRVSPKRSRRKLGSLAQREVEPGEAHPVGHGQRPETGQQDVE
jgi:hypothetical protein